MPVAILQVTTLEVVNEFFAQFEKADFLIVGDDKGHGRLRARPIKPLYAGNFRWDLISTHVVELRHEGHEVGKVFEARQRQLLVTR